MKKISMIFHSMRYALLLGGVVAAMALNAQTASATSISTTFNFVPFGTLTANTGDVTTATTITSGAPDKVTGIITDNTGLISGTTVVSLTDPTPVTLGAVFTKTFSTTGGNTFVETLTVTLVTAGPSSLGVTAQGTIHQTVVGSLNLTDAPVFYSASYTQNGGPGAQINGSFNDSTTPPNVPEPSSIALMGSGLVGIGAMLRRRKLSK